MSLNFFTATKAHQDWKKRLLTCVCGECNETLDPSLIALDDRCALGQWLHAVASANPMLSAETRRIFTRLLEDHAAFHRAAAEVAQQALAEQKEDALRHLQGGDYARISNRVIGTLGELYLKRREFGMS